MRIPDPGGSGIGGTSQHDRWPRALDPAWAPLDSRSVSDLLDFWCRFASLINHYGPDDRVTGDWVEFVTREPLVVLASIASTDLRRAERRVLALERRIRGERQGRSKRAQLVALYDALLDIPRQVERWRCGTMRGEFDGLGPGWHATFEDAIDRTLGTSVQRLKAYDLGAGLPDALDAPLGLDYSGFSTRWRLDSVEPDGSIYAGGSDAERIDRCLPHLLPLWRPMADRVAEWSAMIRPQLARVLEGRGFMQPHIALLVTFARLFGTAQATLNTIGARRTDLYYRRILGEAPRPAVADRVYVALQPAPAPEPVTAIVPAGTLLAGKDAAGREIVFESRDEIAVTSATLSRILTVHVSAGRLAPDIESPRVTQRVFARSLPGAPAAQAGPWAAFGSSRDPLAHIGFAISAPALRLAGGERRITLDIVYAPHQQSVTPVLAAIANRTGLDQSAVLDSVLGQAFLLSVSTPDGWLDVDEYRLSHPATRRQSAFSLLFTLPATAPPLAARSGNPVPADEPVVRVMLRQDPVVIGSGRSGQFVVLPLSVLSGMRVTDVQVRVAVARLPGARVFNPDSEVDPTRPFPAFGAIPAAGSAVRIRHDELFAKQADRITIRTKWYGLPVNRTGFAGYYRQYVIDPDGVIRHRLFDNRAFRASVSVERPGFWTITPPPESEQLYLFRTGEPEGIPDSDAPLTGATTFELRPAALTAPGIGYHPSDSAIRIELSKPSFAFGNTLYAPNTMHAVLNGLPGNGSAETACRGEYAILDDTRRRLQVLLDGSATHRTEALREVEPSSWPRRAGRQLRAAYTDVSQAWRAYIRQRPTQDTQSDWIVRSRYDESDDPGIAGLADLDDDAYRRTMQSTLRSTLTSLLETAAACLNESVTALKDASDHDDFRGWRQQLAAADTIDLAQRLTALRALHLQLAEGNGMPPAMKKCEVVLQAASWVNDCDTDTDLLDRRYARTVRANLRTSIDRLQSLYESSVKACKESGPGAMGPGLPNPPYFPQIEMLAIDYTAAGPAAFSHLLPFGGWRDQLLSAIEPPTLIPQFAHPGNLYLGLSGAAGPQTLHLFVRVQTPTARGPACDVSWEYLDGDRWLPLERPARDRDSTRGLQTSGTIALTLPKAAATRTTILPDDCRWLRACVRQDADASPEMLGILLNAVRADRQIAGTGDVDRPLPPHSVTALVKPVKGIVAVSQPMPSFGGRPAESERGFQTRLAERLRHRGRAVVGWDFERLVLERFPMIWKARVLPSRRRRAGDPRSIGPGHVRIVVVPGPECAEATDPTAPLAGRDRLAAIEDELRAVAGGGVECHVLNPAYIRISVSATVRWRGPHDPVASARDLNTALVEYLSPWSHPASNRVYWAERDVVQFLRSQPDVASLTAVDLDYQRDDAAAADPDRCLLTSAPVHDIRTAAAVTLQTVEGY